MHVVPCGFKPTGGNDGFPYRKVQFPVGESGTEFHNKVFKVCFKQGTGDRWSVAMMEENI